MSAFDVQSSPDSATTTAISYSLKKCPNFGPQTTRV